MLAHGALAGHMPSLCYATGLVAYNYDDTISYVAISPQNNLYESYCNSLDNGILCLKSLYNSLDSAILEKSFPSPHTSIKFPRSRDISLSLGTLFTSCVVGIN